MADSRLTDFITCEEYRLLRNEATLPNGLCLPLYFSSCTFVAGGLNLTTSTSHHPRINSHHEDTKVTKGHEGRRKRTKIKLLYRHGYQYSTPTKMFRRNTHHLTLALLRAPFVSFVSSW